MQLRPITMTLFIGALLCLFLPSCGKSRKRGLSKIAAPSVDTGAGVELVAPPFAPQAVGKVYLTQNRIHGWFCTNLENLNQASMRLFINNRPGQTESYQVLEKSLLPVGLLSSFNQEAVSLCSGLGPVFQISLSSQESNRIAEENPGETLFSYLQLQSSLGALSLELLNSGYLSLPTLCSPDQTEMRTCSVTNGLGMQQRTCTADGNWSQFGICLAHSCTSGFELVGGQCIAIQTPQIETPVAAPAPTASPAPVACSHGQVQIKGRVDMVTQNNKVFIGGWACEVGRNQSIPVHIYVGGAAGEAGTSQIKIQANLQASNEEDRSGINYYCGTSANHRFWVEITTTANQHRGKPLFVYGESSNSPCDNGVLDNSGGFLIP